MSGPLTELAPIAQMADLTLEPDHSIEILWTMLPIWPPLSTMVVLSLIIVRGGEVASIDLLVFAGGLPHHQRAQVVCCLPVNRCVNQLFNMGRS